MSIFLIISDKKLVTFENLRKEVVTPNGTTHAGLKELAKADTHFESCLSRAHSRANELGLQLNKSLQSNAKVDN